MIVCGDAVQTFLLYQQVGICVENQFDKCLAWSYLCEHLSNVVTTNDDNLNNRFAVRNLIQFPNSTIRIFNRWGGEVFRHDDFGSTSGWLPTENDSEGTYYFVLHIERTDQITSITSQSGTSTYEEPGSIDLQGSFMLFR